VAQFKVTSLNIIYTYQLIIIIKIKVRGGTEYYTSFGTKQSKCFNPNVKKIFEAILSDGESI